MITDAQQDSVKPEYANEQLWWFQKTQKGSADDAYFVGVV
jgi:hypothetical protein